MATPLGRESRVPAAMSDLEFFQPVPVPSATSAVFDRLQSLILDGTLRPGERLPAEPQLAAGLRVGRSTVREAKKALFAHGLLESRGRQGTFVAKTPSNPVHSAALQELLNNPAMPDLHESRQIVEVAAIKLATARATADDLRQLSANLERIGREFDSEDVEEPYTRLITFHRNIVRLSRNTVLLSLYDLIAHLLREHQVPYYSVLADHETEMRSHRELIEAMERRNPEQAAAVMTEHLNASEDVRRSATKGGF